MTPPFPVVAADAPDRSLRCRRTLESGGVVLLPTDTLYGLAVDGRNAEALARLNRVKGRAPSTPVLMLAADAEQAWTLLDPAAAPLAVALAGRFWPGPLTLVGPRAAGWPDAIAPGRRTVAVRVPDAAIARAAARDLGAPISGVSANRHGQPAPASIGEVRGIAVDLAIDAGPCPGGAPSTLLDLTARPPRVLREGAVPEAVLREALREAGGGV